MPIGIDYLRRRGWTEDSIELFQHLMALWSLVFILTGFAMLVGG